MNGNGHTEANASNYSLALSSSKNAYFTTYIKTIIEE